MQDRDTQARHESLADVGWQRMSVLLDAEMPVSTRKKRRGGLWLWWSVAAAVLIAASTVFVLYPHQDSDLKPSAPQPTIAAPALAERGNPIPATEQAEADKMEAELAVSKNAQSHKPNDPAGESLVKANVSQVHNATPFVAALPCDIAGEPAPAAFDIPAMAAEVLERWNENTALPVLFPGTLEAAPPTHSLQSPVNRKQPRRLRLGVETAAGISSSGVSALAIGPVAEFKAGRRWSVAAGLQAATARYTLSSGSAGSLRGLSNDPGPDVVFDGTALSLVASSVNNGNQWTYRTFAIQMPVYLGYQFSPRLRAEAGITPTSIWHAEKATGEVDQESLVQTSANFSREELDQAVVSSTERFEMLFSAGLRYQVSPKWSLGVHYQTSLNDLQPLQSLQARQQNLRLSGTMYF